MLKKLIFIIMCASAISIIICSCGTNSNNTSVVSENTTKSTTESTSSLPQKSIKSIDELSLDKITKISVNKQDKEIFSNDVQSFVSVLKTLEPNSETSSQIESSADYNYGFTQIKAYADDTLLYTFILSGKENGYRVYASDGSSYFYCNISDENADNFSDIYSKI